MTIKFTFTALLSIIYIFIVSFLYVYLTNLNPIIYLNFIIWFLFCVLIILPTSFLSVNNKFINLTIIILISLISIYLVFGMKSSIFATTVQRAMVNDGYLWIPKVDFADLFNTLFSISEYQSKLSFLIENDSLNLSFKGHKGVNTDSSFTNFFRVIECLGIIVIPIYKLRYVFNND
jgi:hypothetical protein